DAVHALGARALGVHHARGAVREQGARRGAAARGVAGTLAVGVVAGGDGAARSVGAAPFLGRGARLTDSGARGVATDTVDAVVAGALAVDGAENAVGEERARAGAAAGGSPGALAVGVAAEGDVAARSVRARALLHGQARHARTGARGVAAD